MFGKLNLTIKNGIISYHNVMLHMEFFVSSPWAWAARYIIDHKDVVTLQKMQVPFYSSLNADSENRPFRRKKLRKRKESLIYFFFLILYGDETPCDSFQNECMYTMASSNFFNIVHWIQIKEDKYIYILLFCFSWKNNILRFTLF